MKPLEQRFPTLYYDIVHERVAGTDKVEEKREPKATPPNLFNVIEAVCSTHRVTDTTLMKDLAGTITEFLAPPEEKKEKSEKAEKRKKKAED